MLVESFSGIRGVYGRDLKEEVARKYGYAFYSFLKPKKIVIGMDTRHSGSSLSNALLSALPCDVIDVGILPTPAVEHAVRHFKADGGIMITASHNEPYWNGFKFLGKTGAVLKAGEMGQVIALSKRKVKVDFASQLPKREVKDKSKEAGEAYLKFLFSILGKKRLGYIKKAKLHVLLDPNGGAGVIADDILNKAGIKTTSINGGIGDFNRKVEPSQESLFYLTTHIKENNADFAAGFDCDADRVELMMADGRLVSGNHVLAMVVDSVLNFSKKKEHVVVNDATSHLVHNLVKSYQGNIVEVEVGETNVVSMMEELGSAVGGEGSSAGAIVSPSKCRDGILSVLFIAALIGQYQNQLEELLTSFPPFHTVNEKIKVKGNVSSLRKKLKAHYARKKYPILETGDETGGLKILLSKDSFVWFRGSKTESGVFRVIADSPSEEQTQKIMINALKVVKQLK